jgi:hypothetical protein
MWVALEPVFCEVDLSYDCAVRCATHALSTSASSWLFEPDGQVSLERQGRWSCAVDVLGVGPTLQSGRPCIVRHGSV